MSPPFVRCVVHDVGVCVVDPVFDANPRPPKDIDVDLPVWVVVALAKNPDDRVAYDTVMECLRFTLGFMGFSYCSITAYGGITTKGQ